MWFVQEDRARGALLQQSRLLFLPSLIGDSIVTRQACQKLAWKVHKRDCGKKLGASHAFRLKHLLNLAAAVDSVFQDASPIDRGRRMILREDIPPAAPGYHRTAYLLRQISLLNDFPKK